jgi:Holliday junction resolvase
VNTARKGRRAEHRARHALEAAGYTVIRAAASKGMADLVAWNGDHVRLVSVKAGGRYVSKWDRAALLTMPRPAGVSVEIWRYAHGSTVPMVERLTLP